MAVIIQQDATEYSLFKSVNCSTCFGWYFTHRQELITLYRQYLSLMRPVQLPVVNVATDIQFTFCPLSEVFKRLLQQVFRSE